MFVIEETSFLEVLSAQESFKSEEVINREQYHGGAD